MSNSQAPAKKGGRIEPGNEPASNGSAAPPALHLGRMLTPCSCPQCGTANSPERKFCAGCGKPLWEPCLLCGAANGAWEKFCGVCGGNLLEALQAQIEQVLAAEKQARLFQSLCRHEDAIPLLRALTASPQHPRLSPQVERAHQLAEALQAELQRLCLERDDLHEQAQAAFDNHDHEQTIQKMEQVHRRLRSHEMQRLLDHARQAVDEAAMLATEIREAVASKQVDGLLEKVRRLLELKPAHAEAQKLAAHLQQRELRGFEGQREQLFTAGQSKFAAYSYDEAARLLEQIQESVRTPEVNKLLNAARDRAQEVAWLIQDLREIAVFDDFIPSLTERLLKLKPKDEQIARFAERVRQQHLERKEKHRPGQETLLVRGKREAPLGFPIDPLVGFRRIDQTQIEVATAFAENPSAFYVACGLALQGLEKAHITVNLVPPAKLNVFGKLAGSLLKKKPTSVWGIDVGTCSLKALKLTLEAENKGDRKAEKNRVVALACEHIEYAQPLNHPDVEQEKTLREALEQLRQRHTIGEDLICVSFPGQKTLARFIKLPPAEKKKIAELVKFEARQQIPFDLDTVTWGFQTTSGPELNEGIREREVGLFAVRTHEANQFLFPFGQLEMKVEVLQADSVALHNYLHFDRYSADEPLAISPRPTVAPDESEPSDGPQDMFAALDLGTETSNLVISNRNCVWMRSLPVGAHRFNRALVTEFKLTLAQSEQLKRNPLKLPLVSKVYEALEVPFRDLLGEVKRSLSYYEHTYRQRPIKQLYVVGNGAKLHGLIRLLRTPPAESM